jgi:flagellar motor switch protein FliN
MSGNSSVIRDFIETWVGELTQAIEMFSGTTPTIGFQPIPIDPARDIDSLLWVDQGFQRGGDFSLWIGADEQSWTTLGAILGEGDPDTYRANYLEILGQAHHGSANTLSSPGKEFTCREGTTATPPNFDPLDYAMFSVQIEGQGYGTILLVIDTSADRVIEPPAAAAKPPTPKEEQSGGEADDRGEPPILGKLLDMELPISVGIGSAFLPIKDVLKYNPGSVVALNREVGEPIDLMVHGTLVARGDVVLVKGNFGVRITEIVNREERLRLCRS